ncbi:hypothetical protein JAAARDRAFT_156976 [Jaapia argillacea MUCL 33604]|uniref:Uncharacterized protein n=1 Tax=Jaapia argillacea MUCL 33604 TaxID=933084 RepID=A0A067PQF0_9AGAM|nr:hypothetical protein JAAARDRAFT_156976 [Jaapia argillacea MUCL 33604]
MAYQPDVVSGADYRYALTNFRIAHEKVEEQRRQLEEQERQVALLRARIATLEGGSDWGQKQATKTKQGGSSVDDFSIKNAASKLERLINRWAADIIRTPPAPLEVIRDAVLSDLTDGDFEPSSIPATPMKVQSLLRHAMSESISEGIVNCLIVTDSPEANIQLTRIHEHLFARDPTVACVWRRQTFSAAVEHCSPEMSQYIMGEQLPALCELLSHARDGVASVSSALPILEAGYEFSRMLHGSNSAGDAFYRSFVPELSSALYPRQIELIKRCMKSERGELDKVGATIFPGLVKVSRGPVTPGGQPTENVQTVVRRAQVVCECALSAANVAPSVNGSSPASPGPHEYTYSPVSY